jgi:hypothetical protein
VVGTYPYLKNDPRNAYWDNIGAGDSLYGGITVFTFKDDPNIPNVKVDGEVY